MMLFSFVLPCVASTELERHLEIRTAKKWEIEAEREEVTSIGSHHLSVAKAAPKPRCAESHLLLFY